MADGGPSIPLAGSTLVARLACELANGCDVIKALDDTVYCLPSPRTGSVGAQFRHNLDVATALLNGVESGEIDYGKRERDPKVEADRGYAVDRFASLIGRLMSFPADVFSRFVRTRSESCPDVWLSSTIDREIDYVYAHTVHHHALISEKLASFGIFFDREFGVERSTLNFWETKQPLRKGD